jgi:hypothetical protein
MMQSKIGRAVLSGVGVATLSVLSVFGTKTVANSGLTSDQVTKGQGDHQNNLRLACERKPCPTAVGGVRG